MNGTAASGLPPDGHRTSTAGDDELKPRLVPGSLIRPPDRLTTDLGFGIIRPWAKSANNWATPPNLNLNGKSQGERHEFLDRAEAFDFSAGRPARLATTPPRPIESRIGV